MWKGKHRGYLKIKFTNMYKQNFKLNKPNVLHNQYYINKHIRYDLNGIAKYTSYQKNTGMNTIGLWSGTYKKF